MNNNNLCNLFHAKFALECNIITKNINKNINNNNNNKNTENFNNNICDVLNKYLSNYIIIKKFPFCYNK